MRMVIAPNGRPLAAIDAPTHRTLSGGHVVTLVTRLVPRVEKGVAILSTLLRRRSRTIPRNDEHPPE
jgi:hypothetical protein